MIPYRIEREYLEPPRETGETQIICQCCQEAILDGEVYYEIEGAAYCKYCVNDSRRIAEELEPWR